MRVLKKERVFVVLAGISLIGLLFLGFGCGGGGDDGVAGGGQAPPETFTTTEFFPLTSSWETDRWTLFIDVRDHEIDGVMTRAMVDTQFPSVFYWTNDENGLRLHAVIMDDGILRELPTPALFVDALCKVGDRKEAVITIEEEEIKIICELVGVEDVSVPADTFERCLKFVLRGYPVGLGPEEFGSETLWLAKGVGFVKAVAEENALVPIFADEGQTRQLLSYHITPSVLTADEEAITELYKRWDGYWETENPEIFDLLSDEHYGGCRDKNEVQARFEQFFADNRDGQSWSFSSISEIVVNDGRAYSIWEGLNTAVDDASGERWWWWGRNSDHPKKENGEWRFYGDQTGFVWDWAGVRVRNSPGDEPSLQIGMDFIDCETGDYIESPDVISSLTVSGPPGTSIDPDLKQDWWQDPSWRGFWRDDDFANATNGFYTFRVVEAQTGNSFEFTDYLEVMPLLDVPTIISPAGGEVVDAGDVILEWNPVDGAEYYRVEIGYMEDDVYIGMDDIYTTDTQVVLPNLPTRTFFLCRVRARQDDLYGEEENESVSVSLEFSTSGMVGSYDTPGEANGVHVSGSYAYVADVAGGLQIIDISNPSSPSFAGSYDTPSEAWGVYVSDSYAHVADRWGGLQIIDVSIPSSPTFAGSYDTPGEAWGVYVSGSYAYVADGPSGLQIIDVSIPSSPTLAGSYYTPGGAWGVYVSGSYAYVADGGSGLQIIDVSIPSSPTLVVSYQTVSSWALGVYVSGDYAYVANGPYGLAVFRY